MKENEKKEGKQKSSKNQQKNNEKKGRRIKIIRKGDKQKRAEE